MTIRQTARTGTIPLTKPAGKGQGLPTQMLTCRDEGRQADLLRSQQSKKELQAPVISTPLSSRFDSRDLDHFANQVLSAMRKGFGGAAAACSVTCRACDGTFHMPEALLIQRPVSVDRR